MLKTKPLMELFGRAQAAVARRIRRDRGRASEELRPVFDHLEEHFYDVDLNLDRMVRQGVVDWGLRERFREEMGMAIKPYLLRLKEELARWLLGKTHLQVRHVADFLGYSRPSNFSRDFRAWTGQSPEAFRAARRGWSSRSATQSGRAGRVAAARERICSRLGMDLPPIRAQGLAAVAPGKLLACLAGPQAGAMAELVWELVREETSGRQLQLLRHKFLFGGPELFELLSRLSREQGRRNRRRGVELAENLPAADRGQQLNAYQDLAYAYTETSNDNEAKRFLLRAKALCEELDRPMNRHQLEWIEGRLAQSAGEDGSAERLFRQARAGFEELGDKDAAALAALELAILCHEQGRISEVMELVVSAVIPVFEQLRLCGEALAAMKLLREAVAVEAVSLAALRKARDVLRQVQRDPARAVDKLI